MPRKGQHPIGATNIFLSCISIHAPLRGATRTACCLFRLDSNFNPRPSARGDDYYITLTYRRDDFNPRPSARGDFCSFDELMIGKGFQSTPLCEGRRTKRHVNNANNYFNPRPSARGDSSSCLIRYVVRHFNPRPSARGDFS